MTMLITPLIAFLVCQGSTSSAATPPLKVCLVSGSFEYDSHTSLAAFKKYLEEHYNAQCTLVKARSFNCLPGLEALDQCEVALFFTRRLTIAGEPLERIKKYCLAGRPIVAVRTASHGFQNWLEFDQLVLGGNYHGHYPVGPTTKVEISPEAKGHPLLEGIGPMQSTASLYKTAPLAPDCQLLMTGSTPESKGWEPVAWTRLFKGARVFYTSLGAPQDFANETFRRLLVNALFWTAKRRVEHKATPDRSPAEC